MKQSKLSHMVEKLNSKLSCIPVVGDSTVVINHSQYGHICILNSDEDLRLAEEIIRDELFDKSEGLE